MGWRWATSVRWKTDVGDHALWMRIRHQFGGAWMRPWDRARWRTAVKWTHDLPSGWKLVPSGELFMGRESEQLSRSERIERLLDQFRAIKTSLDAHINGIPDFIPAPSELKTLASLKPMEDMLDALICAWMGIEHLEGLTTGLGDATAAIWVPTSLVG